MLPDPLHPAVVHLPIALALLVPLVAGVVMLAAARGFLPVRTWWLVLGLQLCLVGSAWLAVETGEEEEDRVERVVAERHIEAHEEAGERLPWIAALALLVSVPGVAPGRLGALARPLALVLSLGTAVLAADVGHSGGELVYRHGAADAYASDRPARDR